MQPKKIIMKEYDYNLESLSAIFTDQAERAEKMQQELIEKYKENYPDSPLPEHFEDSFNVARALSVISSELVLLKQKKG